MFDFILASASPRRRDLLTQAGYNFDIVISDVDEKAFQKPGILPADFAHLAARAKASAVSARFPNSLVIAADTVIDYDSQIIGKPADAAEAEDIIRKLFSKPHKVITAVAILRQSDNIEMVKTACTAIFPKPLTEAQIAEHISHPSRWQGKAGAYGIQSAGSDQFIERYNGSLSNVMGLPMKLLTDMLRNI